MTWVLLFVLVAFGAWFLIVQFRRARVVPTVTERADSERAEVIALSIEAIAATLEREAARARRVAAEARSAREND